MGTKVGWIVSLNMSEFFTNIDLYRPETNSFLDPPIPQNNVQLFF